MINIFYRVCESSNISANKARPDWFFRHRCLYNAITRLSPKYFDRGDKLYIICDGDPDNVEALRAVKTDHCAETIRVVANSGGDSFCAAVDIALDRVENDDDIIYFLEDDYLHLPFYDRYIVEGLGLGAEHVTLFDHRDKYFLPEYNNLKSSLLLSESCHWRTTPSTTDTFACRLNTLKKYEDVYKKYSQGKRCSQDHQRFVELWSLGSNLISPIPGVSTHCEPDYLSPFVNWGNI